MPIATYRSAGSGCSQGDGTNRVVRILECRSGGNGADVFCDNKMITSHYTVVNFVPKNLLEQFTKPANIYFLLLSLYQVMPRITTTGQFPSILIPLVCILALNGVKDAIEDWRRHCSDRVENERSTICSSDRNSVEADTKWSDVEVGSLIVVRNNDYVPADMVMLASSHAEGQVLVETANLDGETNLKTKQAPSAILQLLGKHERYQDASARARQLVGHIECDGPNEYLYSFMGTLYLSSSSSTEEQRIPLDDHGVVLRGCKVKNVQWALGVAVYTGKQCKISQNSKERKGRKLSHLEWDLGKFTGAMFFIQTGLCLLAAVCGAAFETSEANLSRRYLNLTDRTGSAESGFLIFIIRFFNFIILFSNFIPISLLVSVSLVKLIQVFFIYNDISMIHDGVNCVPRTSDLNEEMGQVDYVFSDKTGTLTCNIMDFRKFCVEGISYGEGMTEIRRNVLLKMGRKVEEPPPRPRGSKTTPHVDLVDPRLDALLSNKTGAQYKAVRDFLMHLAINHEVLPETENDGQITYSASSPDEAALCYGARHFGVIFKSRDSEGITLEFEDGTVLRAGILAILKFTSARKRSSVIATFEDVDEEGAPRCRTTLFTKGADSVIIERLAPRMQNTNATLKSLSVLKEFAEDGLRTLCLAGRDLTQEELEPWLKRYAEACCATQDRQERLDQMADELEMDLEMHGITGIEDRLQDDVGGTILKMAAAGIRVWMLTGDKTEIAINIGIATGLLEPFDGERGERPVFSSSDFEVDGVFRAQEMIRKLRMVAERAREVSKDGRMFEGFVIDGRCLEVALEANYELDFVAISRICKTVICCRVSPKQKGAVVCLIKREEKAITLAIGDGANDCNMITSADVGVGIRGLEGLQAFNVCDYGISQFRFLQCLLLVHGRWCYRRVAILVNYTFYKNIVVVLPVYLLGIVSGFSGQKLYNDILYQSYNVVHSMLPIVLLGILDQDVSRTVSIQHPELYRAGIRSDYLNMRVSLVWLLSGFWHAIVIFFVPYYTMTNGNMTHSDGKANDIWLLGTVVYLLVVLVVNLRALMETYFVSWITGLGLLFSFAFWILEHGYLSGLFTGTVVNAELHGSTQRLFSSPMIFLVMLTSTCLALCVDWQCKGIQCCLFPSELHKVQEQVLLEHKRRFNSQP